MKVSGKRNRWHRRGHKFLTWLIVMAFCGFFLLVWKVHAFDVQKALPASKEVAEVVVQEPKSSSATKLEVNAASDVAAPALAPAFGAASANSSELHSKSDRWSDGDVVSALSSFYQTIITMMGLLLGVIGVLAVITLRFLSKTAAEDIAHEAAKEAMAHYLETRQFGDNVKYAIEETGLAYQLEKLEQDINSIKSNFENIKKRPTRACDDEDLDGDVVPGDWSKVS